MVKSLINRLKKGVLIATTGLFLWTACPCPYIPPIEPTPTPTPVEETVEPTAEATSTPEETPVPTAEPTAVYTPEPTLTPVPEYVNITGRLEDCENDGISREGIIKVYNATDDSLLNTYSVNGDFSITLDKLVEELPDGIKIKAWTGSETNPTSYARSIDNLPAGNINSNTDPRMNPAIGPTPFYSDFDGDGYADIDVNRDGIISQQEKEDFKEHVGRENIWSKNEREAIGISGFVNGNRDHGLKKWNHGELPDTEAHPTFRGFKIDTNYFSEIEQDEIENVIRTTNYSGASEIQILREANPGLELGWVPIYHSEPGNGPYAVLYDLTGSDGYLEYAEVYLNTTAPSVVRHEAIYHVLRACPGHSNGPGVPALFDSIGTYTAACEDLTTIDTKKDYITKKTNLGMEPEDNILGLSY